MADATDPSYFEAQYESDADPWGFDTLWYERRKHQLTVAALPRERYSSAFEAGCANGALTEQLALRCESLFAMELLSAPARRARKRLEEHDGVTVEQGRIPDRWPGGTGDLVVLSEVAYYLSQAELAATAERLKDWLQVGGHVVSVHYSGTTNYPQTAKAISAWLNDIPMLERRLELVDECFLLDVWERRLP